MASIGEQTFVQGDQAIADLFFAGDGFRFSDDVLAYQSFSRQLSKLAGRPIVVVNLADLPHAFKTPQDIEGQALPYSDEQVRERSAALQDLCKASLPDVDEDLWMSGDWVFHTVKHPGPNVGALHGHAGKDQEPESVLTPRMKGDCWSRAAIVLVPDRRWSDKAMWSYRTGLNLNDIVKYARGEGAKILSFFHELGHILQLGALFDKETPSSVRWAYESDADKAEMHYGQIVASDPRASASLSRSIRLAMALEAPVRALARFICMPDFYGTALVLDSHMKGQTPPSFDRVCAVEDELRWRCYDTRLFKGGQRPLLLSSNSDSVLVQNTTRAWRQNDLSDKTLNDPITDACGRHLAPRVQGLALQILHEVVTTHPVTDPLTVRAAQLVLRAAEFFSPQIFSVQASHVASRSELVAPVVASPARRRSQTAPLPTGVIVRVPQRTPLGALHA